MYQSSEICIENATVVGESNTSVILTGLTKNIKYEIAVKAATAIGYGPLGERGKKKTKESR